MSPNPNPEPAAAPHASDASPRLLFVPVSGPFGMGEFARCLNLAVACRERWPHASIRFLLSAQAPYAHELPFESVLLPSSPTFHTPEVVREIERFRPTVVIFDNAGRSAQLAAARRAGAALVYISARARQRRKAFRLRWLRLIDEHWIAWPRFMAGPLTAIERLKMRLGRGSRVRYLDCVLPDLAAAAVPPLLQRVPAAAAPFILMVPGGGTGHPRALHALQAFRDAAAGLARDAAALPVILVVPDAASVPALPGLHAVERMPLPQLLYLLRRAELVLCNGGDTLIQAIAVGTPAVAVAIAGDQPGRIRAALRAGAAREAQLDAGAMTDAVRALLRDKAGRDSLRAAARALALKDALSESVEALAALLR